MGPMELYILSVYKFEFFQRSSTGFPGFVGVRVCSGVFTLSEVLVWNTLATSPSPGEASLWSAVGSGALHFSVALQAVKAPVPRPHPTQLKLGSFEPKQQCQVFVVLVRLLFPPDTNIAQARSTKTLRTKNKTRDSVVWPLRRKYTHCSGAFLAVILCSDYIIRMSDRSFIILKYQLTLKWCPSRKHLEI